MLGFTLGGNIMIFYVPALDRHFWISPEVEARLRERAAETVHQVRKQMEQAARLRRIGVPEDRIKRITRSKPCPSKDHQAHLVLRVRRLRGDTSTGW
jgi:hypothetical protein